MGVRSVGRRHQVRSLSTDTRYPMIVHAGIRSGVEQSCSNTLAHPQQLLLLQTLHYVAGLKPICTLAFGESEEGTRLCSEQLWYLIAGHENNNNECTGIQVKCWPGTY